jgi:UDP-N-acetylglucosamine 3-dehydrogenase
MEQGSKDSHVSRLLSRDMGRIRVAVAGLGKMGTYHVQALRRLAKGESEKYYKSGLDTQIRKLELCGLCDPDPEKSRRLAPDLPCFTDWQVLLAKASPDFVVIASPTETHFPLALQSLEAGVHTFVEKPLVTKLGEFKILNDAASSNGCRLISGHVERYNPVAIKLRTMLSEKLIDVAGYRFQRSQPRDARIPDDIVTDKIVHDLDLAQYFFGAIIYYHMVNSKRADGRIQEATVFLRHASGVEGTLFVSWLIQDARKCREIRISCRDGSCMLGDFADKKLTMDGKALSCDVPSWVKPDNNQIKDELADFVSYCILPDPDMPVFQPLLQTWEIKDSIAIIEDLVRWTQSPGDTDCRQEQEADDDKICKR